MSSPANLVDVHHKFTSGGTTIDKHVYVPDKAFNRTQETATWRDINAGSQSDTYDYTYDALDRLRSATYSSALQDDAFTYHDDGNRNLWTRGGTALTAYTYDAAGRMTADAAAVPHGYDDKGNNLNRGTAPSYSDTFTYDNENRMTGRGSGTFTANYDGVRATKVAGGVTTRYVPDFNRSLPVTLVEKVSTGDVTYLYGLARIARLDSDNRVRYYHHDGLGSVRAMTNTTNTYTADVQAHSPLGYWKLGEAALATTAEDATTHNRDGT